MAKRAKTKGGKKRTTKTPVRNIGATVEKYVQIRKEKNGVLYKATEDPDTGGISFLPKTRKTPISFDGRRHKLVEKTPEELSAAKSEQDFLLAADKPANHQKKRATVVYTSRRAKRAERNPSKRTTKETKKLSTKKDVVSSKQTSAFKSTGIKSASTPETIVSSDEEKQSPAKPAPTKLRKHVRAKRSQVSSSSGQNDWRVHGAIDW
mmetsp:Transcript_24365/g.37560  ORF Transcript_24365/g.37560 Transcript_24365/m.37560 type:complete len:207 (-) Transcript_24365:288-908(-)